MFCQLRLLLLSVLLLSITCSQEEKLFTLADSQTRCTIVVDLGPYSSVQEANDAYNDIDWIDNKLKEDNACRVALAAIELQHYLSRILNIPESYLPIVDDQETPKKGNLIVIGLPNDPGLKDIVKPVKRLWRKQKTSSDQAVRIDSFYRKYRRGLILSGKNSTGTLYAVYELLTRYGVRWFAPGDDAEFVPRLQNIKVFSIHEFFDPSMKIRGFWIDARRPANQGDMDIYRWLGRNRINLFWNREADVGALKQRGVLLNTGRQNAFTTLIRPEYAYRYNHPNMSHDEHYQMDPYMVSDLFRGDVDHDKILSYQEAHPEWFDLEIDSVTGRASVKAEPHICLSNTDAVKEFSQIIVDKLLYGEWQTCDIVDLWEPIEWCTCSKCLKMGNSADKLLYLIYNTNLAIREAQKHGSLTRPIAVHGYIRQFGAKPPSISLPKGFNDQNVAVFLFTGPRCYNHYIISPSCTAINIWFARSLLEWRADNAIYQGDLYIAENYNADYIHTLPATHSEMMRLDIPAFIKLGITGINFQHVRFRNNGVQKLLNYQFARQSWNSDTAVDTLRNEFFAYYYQDAAEVVRKYYERIELAMATISTWGYYLPQRVEAMLEFNSDSTSWPFLIDERFVAADSINGIDFRTLWENTYHNIFEARYLLDQLDTLTLQPHIRKRVTDLARQLRYTELTVNLYDNIISYLTCRKDEDYIKEEAILRMNENKARLLSLQIESTFKGAKNAYEDSGVQNIVDILNSDFRK